jgi:hypothetical protein
MGTRFPFPGAKARPWRDADHSPHLAPRSRMSRSYTSLPSSAFLACSGTALAVVNTLIVVAFTVIAAILTWWCCVNSTRCEYTNIRFGELLNISQQVPRLYLKSNEVLTASGKFFSVTILSWRLHLGCYINNHRREVLICVYIQNITPNYKHS